MVGILLGDHMSKDPRSGQALLNRLGGLAGRDDLPLAVRAGVRAAHLFDHEQGRRLIIKLLVRSASIWIQRLPLARSIPSRSMTRSAGLVLGRRREAEGAAFQSLVPDRVSILFSDQELDPIGGLVSEDEDVSRQRIAPEPFPDQGRQTVERFSKIDRFAVSEPIRLLAQIHRRLCQGSPPFWPYPGRSMGRKKGFTGHTSFRGRSNDIPDSRGQRRLIREPSRGKIGPVSQGGCFGGENSRVPLRLPFPPEAKRRATRAVWRGGQIRN